MDFAATTFPQNAGWYLDWTPEDLQQPMFGDVRLYINSRHQRVAEAVSNNSPEAADLKESVRLDLAQTLIRGALSNDEFVENPDSYSPGTTGAVVRSMIRLYFEGYSLAELRSIAQAPHEFSAMLQEKLKIFTHES
jgi:hypothetical protein